MERAAVSGVACSRPGALLGGETMSLGGEWSEYLNKGTRRVTE